MPKPEALHGIDKYQDLEYWQQLRQEFGIPDFDPMELIDVEYYLKNLPLNQIALKARGNDAIIPSGGLPERINPYLQMLIFLTGGPPGPIGLQFVAQPEKEHGLVEIDRMNTSDGYVDSLIEDEHEVPGAPGLIHKYKNRVLFVVTGQCAAYCRYCTRGRLVGKKEEGAKTIEEIDQGFAYIKAHPEITEIIFSGGDSFILPPEIFKHIIDRTKEFQDSGQLNSVRFGTRSIIHNPSTLRRDHLEGLSRLLFPNVMLHYNHPFEITAQVSAANKQLIQAGARLHSQSVLLKGVNDDRSTLIKMLEKGHKYGINPYYIYLCDLVSWGKHFWVSPQQAVELTANLRAEMSGLAGSVRVVIDVPGGHGKITLLEGFWIDEHTFRDYKGVTFRITAIGDIVQAIPVEIPTVPPTPGSSGETTVFKSPSKE